MCQILVAGFAVLLLTNVVLRHVFSAPLFFAEETAIFMLIWMTYFAAAASIARGEMVSLTILPDLLPGNLRLARQVVVHLLMAVMFIVLFQASINWLRSPGTGYDLALTLGLPK